MNPKTESNFGIKTKNRGRKMARLSVISLFAVVLVALSLAVPRVSEAAVAHVGTVGTTFTTATYSPIATLPTGVQTVHLLLAWVVTNNLSSLNSTSGWTQIGVSRTQDSGVTNDSTIHLLYRMDWRASVGRSQTTQFHLSFVFQLLYAVNFLHFNCYQHRDIRDANIVFEAETDPSEVKSQIFRLDAAHAFEIPLRFGGFWMVPTLIDFGLTANMLVEEEQSGLTDLCVHIQTTGFHLFGRGSPS